MLPVGLGALDDGGFSKVGEPTDRKVRAGRLDEGLEILTGLWSGEPFSYESEHYRLEEMTFLPPPILKLRIPIWVVGAWPSERSMRRALRYDGLLAGGTATEPGVSPADIRPMREYVGVSRETAGDYDIVWEGVTPGDDPARAAETVRPHAEARATCGGSGPCDAPERADGPRRRIEAGPPRVEV